MPGTSQVLSGVLETDALKHPGQEEDRFTQGAPGWEVELKHRRLVSLLTTISCLL